MSVVSLSQFVQALSMLPQIVESIKKMEEGEKRTFVEQLGLEEKEKESAYVILTCFQEGKSLTPDQQASAQKLLDRAMQMNNLDLSTLLGLTMNKGKSEG